MSSRIKRKLNSRAGESISETLVSLLIASLALVMLAGTLTASSGIITKGRAKLEKYYDANEEDSGVVKMKNGDDSTSNTIAITITEPGTTNTISQSCNVNYYKNDTFSSKIVIAYKPNE